jgi:plastocyanin
MFCRTCGKGLALNPDKTCANCGSYVIFCRNCGKGLVLNSDKTCASCCADAVNATSFCRYCGKPTNSVDLNCPACGSSIKTFPGGGLNKKTQRIGKSGEILVLTLIVAFVILWVVFSLPAKKGTESALIWLSSLSAPPPKIDSSKNETIDLVIQNGTFYPDKIYAEAGSNLFINFTNKDIGIEHNFVIYRKVEDNPVQVVSTDLIQGPATVVYKIKVPRFGPDGTYWFVCNKHYATEDGLFYPTWPTP